MSEKHTKKYCPHCEETTDNEDGFCMQCGRFLMMRSDWNDEKKEREKDE